MIKSNCKRRKVKSPRRDFNNPNPVCGVNYRNGSIASLEESRLEAEMFAALAAEYDRDHAAR